MFAVIYACFLTCLIKVRMFRFSGPTVHLKLEGLSWFPSLWTTDICTVRGLSIEESRVSPECTDHVFFLAASQGGDLAPYRLMAHFGCGLKQGYDFSSCSKYQVFDTFTPINFLLKIPVFPPHYFLLLLFCCDHILMIGFAQAFSCLFS